MAQLDDYKGTLPYASELFGIYQPLLGWKSKRIRRRFDAARLDVYRSLADRVLSLRPQISVKLGPALLDTGAVPDGVRLHPLDVPTGSERYVAPKIDSAVARIVSARLGPEPPDDWQSLVGGAEIGRALADVQKLVTSPRQLEKNAAVADYVARFVDRADGHEGDGHVAVQALLERESSIAGYLSFLAMHSPSSLTALFYKQSETNLLEGLQFADPLLNFGQSRYDAILSPIGIVHLFREYFFEFDSFLGPSVGHQWLSPGGTVELIEINTRRMLTERTLEMLTETTSRSETQTTTQDDVADAVKDENRNDIKFGVSNVTNASAPFVQDTATVSFGLDSAKTSARESTHKRMRQQSERLSSEIKRSFKTTFKTSTEVTDTSSKRYVLQNTTDKLVNYELRRKMRKVGVQVQDIGTQLCWTAFVDDPGRALGVAKLVHIAKPADLGDLPQPDAPEMPKVVSQEIQVNIPFVGIDTDDTDNAYTDGNETEVGIADEEEHIVADFPQSVAFTQPGYTLQPQIQIDPQGADARLSIRNVGNPDSSSTGTFTIHLDYVNWNGQSSIPAKVTLLWAPGGELVGSANNDYANRTAQYNAEKARRFKEAFYDAARERIKLASSIQPRPAEELREEERTVVYRALIKQLMSVGDGSKHVISELVRSIFDVDKMLYFVAPEWWAPRRHESGQQLGQAESSGGGGQAAGPGHRAGPSSMQLRKFAGEMAIQAVALAPAAPMVQVSPGPSALNRGTAIPAEDVVDWGGAREAGRDNYYITEDSAPAKLGSSLGWLLQLDGDNLRNALLNSPWVKAVIPIRLGKEHEAIEWLKQAHVEGSDGLDAAYSASPGDPPELQSGDHVVTIEEALDYLIDKIHEFDETAAKPIVTNPADPESAQNHFAGSLPTEAVFEHGFYPLQGGVHFEGNATEQTIFSQWTEILPTDQIVALEIEYDPKTLQVKES